MKKFPDPEMIRKLSKRYPSMNREAQVAFMEVVSVVRRLNCGMDSYFQTFGISQAGFKTLMVLLYEEEDGASPAAISDALGVTRATITGLLDTLENNDWITRSPDPNDRRALLIEITQAGRDKLDSILPTHYARIARSMSVFTVEEQRMLQVLIKKFSQGLDALEESAKDNKKEDDL